jgi:hypothetical protein
MGQKRTQNVIDKQIGKYLANFERDLLARVDERITDRMDMIIAQGKDIQRHRNEIEEEREAIKESIRGHRQHLDKSARFFNNFRASFSMYAIFGCLIGGAFGGFVMWMFLG